MVVGHGRDVWVAAVLAAQKKQRQAQRGEAHKQWAQQALGLLPLLLLLRLLRAMGRRLRDVDGRGDDGRQLQRVAGGDEEPVREACPPHIRYSTQHTVRPTPLLLPTPPRPRVLPPGSPGLRPQQGDG